MKLIIVESPTKSKTLQNFLGPKYKVLSSYGHIRDLPKGELGVDVENDFEPKYVIPTKARKNLNSLKQESQKADVTILATDEDREGEAIAWHLSQSLTLKNKKTYQRIAFHEITKPAVEEALKNPREIDMNLVNAQQARRVLDRIVGYKLSPFLWKKVARGLSAGRVQSVAVRLVVEKEREIEKFNPQEYWTIIALLKKYGEGDEAKASSSASHLDTSRRSLEKDDEAKASSSASHLDTSRRSLFEAFLIKQDEKPISKLDIKTEKEAKSIVEDLKNAKYQVINIEKKEVRKNPLPPFTTSTLQQEAWRYYKFPAKFTMRLAQRLYETGKITYHRTDSLNLSDTALIAAKKFIAENYGDNYYQFRKFKTKSKGAQEAHEAIRPTRPNFTPRNSGGQASPKDKNEEKLYDLIWRRFIGCQMKEALFNSTTADIEANKCIFRANGQSLKFDGFLKVYPKKGDESKDSSLPFANARVFEETELPALEKKEGLELIKLNPLQHFTQPPARFTEATLIKALETQGIGRPSTYAPIISTIQDRNYIEKDEKKHFLPTEIGLVVNDILVNHFPEIVDIKFTADMEEKLDEIAQGQKEWKTIMQEFYNPFSENLEKKYRDVSKKEFTEQPTKKTCPKCDGPLLVRLGKFGKFYACSKFPKCRYTESLQENALGIKCPKCKEGKVVTKRTKKNKIFYGCSLFPKCDFALWDKPVNETCPKCNSLLVEKYKKLNCSNKECNFKK